MPDPIVQGIRENWHLFVSGNISAKEMQEKIDALFDKQLTLAFP